MASFKAKKVQAWHFINWNKWPDTEDTDYSEILAKRWQEKIKLGEDILEFECRYYPVYAAQAGTSNLDAPTVYPGIDNTKEVDPSLLRAQQKLLQDTCEGADIIVWDHARQCHPELAGLLPNLVPLRVLFNADDCEASSPIRTFPIATYFNAYLHWMDIYDHSTGKRVRDIYADRGLPHTYLGGSGCSFGLLTTLQTKDFDPIRKATALRGGFQPEIDLVWLGSGDLPGYRETFVAALNEQATLPALIDLSYRLHGRKMLHGFFEDATTQGQTRIADLYWMSLTGINIQFSSLYNMRLWDLWYCGVVQLLHDCWGELKRAGFLPNVHYIPLGEAEDVPELVRLLKRDKDLAANIIKEAYHLAQQRQITHSSAGAFKRIYRQQLLPMLKPE